MPLGSLAVRKALLARIIACDELDDPITGCDEPTRDAVRALYRELQARTETEIVVPNDDVPLDHYVQMVVQPFTEAVRLKLKTGGPQIAVALKRICQRAEDLSCSACSGQPLVCNGGDYDDEFVTRGGHCIQPFADLFALAVAIARDYHAAAGIDPSIWPECEFRLGFVNLKPHPFASPPEISGETSPERSPVRLTLVLQPKSFDWAAFAAVPYVLLHEAFHVVGGIAGILRQGACRQDPFAEGWLDWIAFRALERTASGEGPAARHAAQFRHPGEQINRARQLHLARADETTSADAPLSREIHAGQLAAERFFDLCQRFLPSEEDEDWLFFLSVSLRLNLEAMTLMQHRTVVWRVLEAIPFRRDLGSPQFAETARTLRKYFILKDVGGLIEWLRSDE